MFHYPAGSVDVTPPKYNSESQVCSWDGKKWIVSDIVVPEILEPKAKVFPEPEEEPVSEPEPYEPTEYWEKRCFEYGLPHEQLEFITENGLKAWQTKVTKIKAKFPKP